MPSEAPQTQTQTPKAVRLDLPARTHKLLRRVAAEADLSMASYTREMLIVHLEAEAKRKGIKV